MSPIFITSDTDPRFVGLDTESIVEWEDFIEDKNYPIIQIFKPRLPELKSKIEDFVNSCLLIRESRKDSNKKIDLEHIEKYTIEVKWNECNVSIFLKNELDVQLVSSIVLHEMVVNAIKTGGNIFIYAKDFLSKDFSGRILAYIKIYKRLHEKELKKGLMTLYANKDFNLADFQIGLEKLQNFGMIFFDKSSDEYLLTARGFLFQ